MRCCLPSDRSAPPCRGGIPLVFPQYGRASGVAAYAGVGNPAVPTHGFLSHLHWTLVDAGGSDPDSEDPSPTVVLEAESTTETYAVWPYHFRAFYTVSTPSRSLQRSGAMLDCHIFGRSGQECPTLRKQAVHRM